MENVLAQLHKPVKPRFTPNGFSIYIFALITTVTIGLYTQRDEVIGALHSSVLHEYRTAPNHLVAHLNNHLCLSISRADSAYETHSVYRSRFGLYIYASP